MTLLGVFVTAAALPACSTSPTSPTPTTTTSTTTTSTTTAVSVTETFNGTLSGGSSDVYTFHTLPGVVTTTLVSVDPSSFTAPIGLGVGTWDGSSCTVVILSATATAGTVLTGSATTEIDLCVRVFDLGTLAPTFRLNYQVTAVHLAKPS